MFFQNAVFPIYILLLPLIYTYFTCPRCSSRQCSYLIFCITNLSFNNLQCFLNTLQDLPQLSSTHSLPYYKFHFHALMMLHVGFFLHLHPIFIYVTFSIFIYTYLSSLQLQTEHPLFSITPPIATFHFHPSSYLFLLNTLLTPLLSTQSVLCFSYHTHFILHLYIGPFSTYSLSIYAYPLYSTFSTCFLGGWR